jgi:hypothetical protein
MKVTLVNYEKGFENIGILSKYADKMEEELIKLGVEVKVDNKPDPKSDVNHHINYIPYRRANSGGIDTLMITHITADGGYTTNQKLEALKHMLNTSTGVCFSKSMKDKLIGHGCPEDKLDVITPAHDSLKRRPIIIAILTKAYEDGRKNENMVVELAKVIDKDKFAFRIMGHGWREIIKKLQDIGFNNVEYFEDFDMEIYNAILYSADYLLYTGKEDEGAMSVVDGVNANLRIISTVSGFHHDLPIDYPFSTQEELNAIFKKLEINPVEDWNWTVYTQKHLDLWKSLSK